jgi:ABC-2 type transport system ATP-binding protein
MWQQMQEVNAQGTTIILTTHYLEEAESLCRNIAIIDQGDIVENSRMSSLLARLHVDYFILDLENPIDVAPEIPGYSVTLEESRLLNVGVPKEKGINQLFQELSMRNIQVLSLKNKSNRLEQLFMDRIEQNKPAPDRV